MQMDGGFFIPGLIDHCIERIAPHTSMKQLE